MNNTKEQLDLTEYEIKQWHRIQEKQTLSIALSGHFSAGKSSLINHLTGVSILPTSPIPTSANQITIAYGDLEVIVVHVDGSEKSFRGEIDWEAIKRYAMDGANVEKLNIYAPIPFLKHAGSLVDTPGVDSTDPTHQNMTLEALFTTDILLYVMDYNHVKSETNLGFLKQLSDEGKPLFIVVNQIDKHNEEELSFQSYKDSIIETLANWSIQYQGFYMTTIKDSPHNELHRLKDALFSLFYYGRDLVQAGKKKIEYSFYKSIQRRIEDDWEEERASLEDTIQSIGFELDDVDMYQQRLEAFKEAEAGSTNRQQRILKEWDDLFRQATLFNSTLTEKTLHWLHAMRPNFKMGFLSSKRKIMQERQRRQAEVIEELNDQINKQVVFHLKQTLQSLPLAEMSNQQRFLNAVHDVTFTVSPAFLDEGVPNSTFADSFVYQFTKDRTEAIKRHLKQRAVDALDDANEQLIAYDQQQSEQAQAQYREMKELEPYVAHYVAKKDKKEALKRLADKEASERDDRGAFAKVLKQKINENVIFEEEDTMWKNQVKASVGKTILTSVAKKEHIADRPLGVSDEDIHGLQAELKRLNKSDVTQDWHQRLQTEAEHITTEQFTLSLFGAFSAGKSSLANALLGGVVLPSSPHPTTATVTTVTRPTDAHGHGDVHIQYKSYEQLRGELASISQLLEATVTLEQLQRFRTQTYRVTTAAKKQALAYIETLQHSMKKYESWLEQEEMVSMNELNEKIVHEEVACFISRVTIYYECEWTAKGLTLVDTPGVNSINGRHTNVAYDQVKASDAILYVTYYNHSFSRADAQFIEQLGKMNQHVSSKKLYFVLNAIDLAANEEERLGVESFVTRSLEEAGIDRPALFSLSSKEALMKESSTDFQQFQQELYGPMLRALKDANRTQFVEHVKQYVIYLQDVQSFATMADHEKSTQLVRFEESLMEAQQAFYKDEAASLFMEVEQEASELFAYLRERTPYISRDRFIEFVNVATIVGSSRKKQKEALEQQLLSWNEDSLFYVNQELKATRIRLSLELQRSFEQWKKVWQQSFQSGIPGFPFPKMRKSFSSQLSPDLLTSTLSIHSHVNQFSSLKTFFEQQQVKQVKEQLVDELVQQIRSGLREEEGKSKEWLKQETNDAFKECKAMLDQQITLERAKRKQLNTKAIQQDLQAEIDVIKAWLHEIKA